MADLSLQSAERELGSVAESTDCQLLDTISQTSQQRSDEPLCVRFEPPAFIQRRALVLSCLRKLDTKCTSLLDVGTGDGGLLRYLVRCDDDVPITRLVGIDPDREALQSAIQVTKPSESDTCQSRWRPLEISLLEGGVTDIKHGKGDFDCVTAIEVLEHLDPDVFAVFPEVCLGQLKPKCLIITTPNRDFNPVFDKVTPGKQSFFVCSR